jgi:peptidoglycan/LPS O-acetylase OafA/YrhL
MKAGGVHDRGLDPLQGLRGLAAVHVMLFHYYQPQIGSVQRREF